MGPIAGAIAGSVVSGLFANKAARTANAGIDRQIAAEREARQTLLDAGRYRAVGFRSPYGTPEVEVDADGNLIGSGFTLSPEMQERAERYGALGSNLLANLQVDPMVAARQRTQNVLGMLQHQRDLTLERTYGAAAAKGLTDYGVDRGTGTYTNPLFASLFEAQAQQDQQIAQQSMDLAREQRVDDLNFLNSLFKNQYGIYDIGRAEQEYGLNLADRERARRLEAAGGSATATRNIGSYTAQMAANNADMYGAIGGQLGRAVGGLFSKPQQTQTVQPATPTQYTYPTGLQAPPTSQWA